MKRKKSSFKYTLLLILIIAVLAFLLRTSVLKKMKAREETDAYDPRPVAVETVTVKRTTIERAMEIVAWVEPEARADFSARAPAYIREINVKEGDTVKEGDVLAELDNRDLEQKLKSMEAQVKEAVSRRQATEARISGLKSSVSYLEKESQRDSHLAEQGAIPLSAAEASKTKYDESKGSIEEARQNAEALKFLVTNLEEQKKSVKTEMDYRIFKAPFDGTITTVKADPGDLAVPGMPVISIEKHEGKNIVFSLPQEDISRVKIGQEVQFLWEGTSFSGNISSIYPSVDEKRMGKVEAGIAEDQKRPKILPSGISFPARVIAETLEGATTVPLSAVFETAEGNTFVYRVVTVSEGSTEAQTGQETDQKQEILQKLPVKIVLKNSEEAALEGVEPGDRVVTTSYKGSILLSDGLRVTSK